MVFNKCFEPVKTSKMEYQEQDRWLKKKTIKFIHGFFAFFSRFRNANYLLLISKMFEHTTCIQNLIVDSERKKIFFFFLNFSPPPLVEFFLSKHSAHWLRRQLVRSRSDSQFIVQSYWSYIANVKTIFKCQNAIKMILFNSVDKICKKILPKRNELFFQLSENEEKYRSCKVVEYSTNELYVVLCLLSIHHSKFEIIWQIVNWQIQKSSIHSIKSTVTNFTYDVCWIAFTSSHFVEMKRVSF